MTLTMRNVEKRLGKKLILKGISADLEPQVVGLLGANGAGKTTLIRCLTGIYDLDKGEVDYEGESIEKSPSYRPHLGYLPQAFGMFRELTVYEMMDYFCALKKVPKDQRGDMIRDCLNKVNLEDRISSRVSTLSGGMTRRAGIAQSLLGDAKVIIMDEPTSGLDPQERTRFKNMVTLLKEQEKLVLLSTHIVEDVDSLCDTVLVMHEGRILFQGDCEALREQARGRVYQVPKEELGRVKGEYYDAQVKKEGHSWMHRMICREPQNFDLLEPTLEDGYMAVMKEFT